MQTYATSVVQTQPQKTLRYLRQEALYVGIDVAKATHVAGFLSRNLLTKHQRFEKCPHLCFGNAREDFEKLVEKMQLYAPLSECHVLLEHTGHYHQALRQFLEECGIQVYTMHAKTRLNKQKTDKGDALSLANLLYNQVEIGIQVADSKDEIHQLKPATDEAIQLKGLSQRRHELSHELTQRKNALIAITDELFPEFTEVFKDPCRETAIAVRTAYPTPTTIAMADIKDLAKLRTGKRPGNARLAILKELAATSIGTKIPGRVKALVIEQRQLIAELHMLQNHIAEIDTEIEKLIEDSRAAKILMSMPGIGMIDAAAIIGVIGNLVNFSSAAKLRSFFGWSPVETQTGTTKNSSKLAKSGVRLMKQSIYLIAWRAIKEDTEWHRMYDHLVEKRCSYDPRTRRVTGKNKVVGRICGQIIGMIYSLLRQDADLVASIETGLAIPDPTLYSREKHREHRRG